MKLFVAVAVRRLNRCGHVDSQLAVRECQKGDLTAAAAAAAHPLDAGDWTHG